jgi:hypothetical protein
VDTAIDGEGRSGGVRDLIAVVSFMVSVMGGLVAMFNRNRDKQTMGAIVGVAFLLAFFMNVSREAILVLQGLV